MLIDTHCHLNYEFENGKGPEILVAEARAVGVQKLITIATDPTNFDAVQKISEQYENVFHSIGVHPHDASQVTEATLLQMRPYLDHPKCVAVGEIGLDYFYEHSDRAKQQAECWGQMELALDAKKPVVIHSRDGEADLLPLLSRFAKAYPASKSPGVIHCFSGTEAFARSCLDLGYYISLSGIFTFKTAESLRQMVKGFPLDRSTAMIWQPSERFLVGPRREMGAAACGRTPSSAFAFPRRKPGASVRNIFWNTRQSRSCRPP